MGNKHYGAIDGLRMLAAFGILMMHMRSYNDYQIGGYFYNTVIASFGDFVFLFMTISAFSMCCGYYEKVLNGRISLSAFYGRRFRKVLPFLAVLVLIDVVREPSASNLYEGFADLTLLFGFLQKKIEVIGVGWFLGLVFVFYLCFPFFCVLIENKRRAWLAFAVSLVYNWVGASYFDVGRSNILYSGCYFLAGGLIYLYREELAKLDSRIAFAMAGGAVILYYLAGQKAILCLPTSAALLVYAIGKRGGGTGEQGHEILQFHQHGDIPFPHGDLSCC